MRLPSTLAVLAILMLSNLAFVAAETSSEQITVEVVIVDTTGTEHAVNVSIADGESGWNASVAAFDALELGYDFSDAEWGIMLTGIDNQSNTAAWGEPDFWYWSLQTDVDGNWTPSMVGASDLSVDEGDRLLWFATDGTYAPGTCTVQTQASSDANVSLSLMLTDGTTHNHTAWTNGCDDGMTLAHTLTMGAGVDMDASLGEWGWFVNSFDNTTADASWGALDYWYWGLFVNDDDNWTASMVGIGDVNMSEGAHYMFAPTFDGAWVGADFQTALDSRAAEQADVDACAAAPHQVTVGEDDMSWSVDALEIENGDSVCFSWSDTPMGHNVASVDDSESTMANQIIYSGAAVSEENFLVTFEENATVHIVCEPHAAIGMRMTITVGDGGDVDAPSSASEREDTPGFTGLLGALALLGAAFAVRRKD